MLRNTAQLDKNYTHSYTHTHTHNVNTLTHDVHKF